MDNLFEAVDSGDVLAHPRITTLNCSECSILTTHRQGGLAVKNNIHFQNAWKIADDHSFMNHIYDTFIINP